MKGTTLHSLEVEHKIALDLYIRTITKYFPSLLFVCLARDLSPPSFLQKVLNLRLDGTPKRKGRKGGKKGKKCEIKSTPLFLSSPPLLLYFIFRFGKEEEEETLNHLFCRRPSPLCHMQYRAFVGNTAGRVRQCQLGDRW